LGKILTSRRSKVETFYAHTPNRDGKWHDLPEHLQKVSSLTRDFAARFLAGEIGATAGLLHDIGKFLPEFQKYLKTCYENTEKKIRGPGHSMVGALYGARIWDGLSVVVAAHHGGLKNLSDLKAALSEQSLQDEAIGAIENAERLIRLSQLPTDLGNHLPPFLLKDSQREFELEFFLRMLYSSLVDADYLDTEKHCEFGKSSLRSGYPNLATLYKRLEESQKLISGKRNDALNKARHEIYRRCIEAADLPQGVYRLTVPTGGGKTRSAMAFALRHALKHDLSRVVVAIPYTSIIEQTAFVYKRIFGREAVVEHHSAAEPVVSSEEQMPSVTKARLASENWDAPVIVTTTIQLFESIFASKPSKCRKIHNLARSVVVLDEAQLLPTGLLSPIIDVLKELTENYGVTLVLCTATQPAIDSSAWLEGFESLTEIVPEHSRYFEILKRVRYEIPDEKWDWRHVAREIGRCRQSLTILNTRKDAVRLLNEIDVPDVLYLSTELCPAHRRDVLAEVRRRLSSGRPCSLVSTQVVEAGVDIDFPVVFRALGPLDRIVQAAGRCNREGRLEFGRVVIFDPVDGTVPPGDYRTGRGTTESLFRSGQPDLHSPDIYQKYFRLLYQAVDSDRYGIQNLRRSFGFESVAENFRMIRDATVPVIVKYDDEASALIDSIRAEGLSREMWRRLQSYTVNVYHDRLKTMLQNGLVEEVSLGLYLWLGAYDSIRGIAEYKTTEPEELIY